jgi:hypothetical protein
MTRTTLAANNLIGIHTNNGGVLTANNAMTKQSAKAQRTATWSTVTAVREDGTTFTTTKAKLQKEAVKQSLKNFIDRF